MAHRAHVGHVNIHVTGEIGRIEHRRRAALADARGDPLAGVQLAEERPDAVQVAGRILGRQVAPVQRLGSRAVEIAVLDEDDVRIEKLRQLVAVLLGQREVGVVTLRDEHRGTVPSDVHHHHALQEAPPLGMAPVERLRQHHLVLPGELARRQGFRLLDAFERGDALPDPAAVGSRRREGDRREQETQKSQSFPHSIVRIKGLNGQR